MVLTLVEESKNFMIWESKGIMYFDDLNKTLEIMRDAGYELRSSVNTTLFIFEKKKLIYYGDRGVPF